MDITELQDLAQATPTYILIAGGIGVGKTHCINHYMPDVILVDLDLEMARLGLTEYTPENMLTARESLSEQVIALMANKQSFVAMGTASDTVFTINRLFWAKEQNYTTVLLHITAPVNQAVMQNKFRRDTGKRAVHLGDEYLIPRTITESDNTVSIVKSTVLVDHFIHYENVRTDK